MRQEIIENLHTTLQKPIEIERVVYIMVEIRKLIDKIKDEKGDSFTKWNNIKYWCDWTVHTKLDLKFAVDTLKAMEKFIIENPDDKFLWSEFNYRFVSLEDLRLNLFEFLKDNDLSTEILNIPPWNDFTKYLIEVLRDCPLAKKDGVIKEFKFIKGDHIPEAIKYSIDYEVVFHDSSKNRKGYILRFEKKSKKPL